jgi:hypothetical protein
MTDQGKKAPLGEFKDGAVTVKLWEQQAGDQTYVNASIGKRYKDNQTGTWKEGRSFNGNDLLKLQTMLPDVRREIQHLQEQQRSVSPQQEKETHTERSSSLSDQRNSVMQEVNRNDGGKSARYTPARNSSQDRSR